MSILALSPTEIKEVGNTDRSEIFVSLPGMSIFDCWMPEVTCHIYQGYKRLVDLSGKIECFVEEDQITKYEGCSGLFPAYFCVEVLFEVDVPYVLIILTKMLEDYLEITWAIHKYLRIKSRDPTKYLIDIDFGAHDNGPLIRVVTRRENMDQKWHMNVAVNLLLDPYNDGSIAVNSYPDKFSEADLLKYAQTKGLKIRSENGRYYLLST